MALEKVILDEQEWDALERAIEYRIESLMMEGRGGIAMAFTVAAKNRTLLQKLRKAREIQK